MSTQTRNGKPDVRDPNRPEELKDIYREMGLQVIEERGHIYGLGYLGSVDEGESEHKDVYVVLQGSGVVAELDVQFDGPQFDLPEMPCVTYFGVALNHRRHGWATRLFEAASERHFSDPNNFVLDHGGHTAQGAMWWQQYCRTHEVDLSRHLFAEYNLDVEELCHSELVERHVGELGRFAGDSWGHARRRGLERFELLEGIAQWEASQSANAAYEANPTDFAPF